MTNENKECGEKELWGDVVNWEGLYQVSSLGRVKRVERVISCEYGKTLYKRTHREKILRQTQDTGGYLCIKLSAKIIGRKCVTRLVHRLVAEAFITNPKNKAQVNHVDGSKTNNCVDNLEWCTPSENQIHSYKLGRGVSRGESHGKNKHREVDVIAVYREAKRGYCTQLEIAKRYGMSAPNVSAILNKISWRHVTDYIDDKDSMFGLKSAEID